MSSGDSDNMEYSSDNECEYDDYYNTGMHNNCKVEKTVFH